MAQYKTTGTDRVIDIKGPAGVDDSGIGNMLFTQFDEQRKRAEEAKQLDITEGIRAKYRMAELEKHNTFEQGMTRLRAELNAAEADRLYQRQQQGRQEAAGHLQTLITAGAQQGIPMPGMTNTEEIRGTPEGSIPEVAKPIAPGAVDVARDAYASALTAHFDKLKGQYGVQAEIDKRKALEFLDVQDETSAAEARSLHTQLKAVDADPSMLILLDQFTQAGKGSKSGWHRFRDQSMFDLIKLQTTMAAKLVLAREISARMTEIARLKTEVSKALLNQKRDVGQFQRMAKIMDGLKAQHAALIKHHGEMEKRSWQEPPNQQAKTLAEMTQLMQKSTEVEEMMAALAAKMAEWSPSGPVTPGAPPPGQEGPTVPGGTLTPGRINQGGVRDDLDIMPRRSKPPRG